MTRRRLAAVASIEETWPDQLLWDRFGRGWSTMPKLLESLERTSQDCFKDLHDRRQNGPRLVGTMRAQPSKVDSHPGTH